MRKIVWIFVFCVLPFFLPAQTAADIEDLLAIKAVSYEQAARLVLKAADLPDFSAGEGLPNGAEAFSFAAERKWLPKMAGNNEEASLEGVSLLIMRSFDLKGGLLYSLTKNPHYAYREMVYKEIIQGRTDPEMAVSGEQLLFLVNRVISLLGNDIDYDIEGGLQNISAAEMPSSVGKMLDQVAAVSPSSSPSPSSPVAPPPPASPPPVTYKPTAEQEALVKEINTQLAAKEVADTSARATNEGITISLSNIQFMANSAELPQSEKRKLQEIARILQTVPGRNVLVAGHTALAGTPQDRMQTSYDRAKAVAAYLISLGTRKPNEIFAQGFGAERPIADNSTPQGMALNRRVEITILEN